MNILNIYFQKFVSWFILSCLIFLFYATIGSGQINFPFGFRYHDLGEFFSVLAIWSLILIYLRSVLRIIIREGWLNYLTRLDINTSFITKIFNKTHLILTRYHPWIGFVAAASIILHCIFISNFYPSPYLRTVFTLMFLQMVLGSLTKFQRLPATLKANIYLWHASLVVLIFIFILAVVGHSGF